MVGINEVRAANESLKNRHDSVTAVFAGATNGIGLATLRAFANHIPKPKAIIIGRSRAKFQTELDNLHSINPKGEYTFLEAEISLIKNIDAVCDLVKSQVSRVDFLFTSQGYISFAGRENNADGLDNSVSLRYYGRLRFTQNLLPIMSSNARVVTVLAGGLEGKIIESDLDLERNYSILNAGNQFATMMTLSFDRLAEQNPDKGFVHVFPGTVSTGLLGRSATGVLGLFFRWIVDPLMGFFATGPAEVGERMLYYGTDEQYAKGCWSLDSDGTAKNVNVLVEYRERGTADKVVEHNNRIFERVTSG